MIGQDPQPLGTADLAAALRDGEDVAEFRPRGAQESEHFPRPAEVEFLDVVEQQDANVAAGEHAIGCQAASQPAASADSASFTSSAERASGQTPAPSAAYHLSSTAVQ